MLEEGFSMAQQAASSTPRMVSRQETFSGNKFAQSFVSRKVQAQLR